MYDALKTTVEQWKLTVPSADVIIPPRFLLSAEVPLCMQQGALKEVHPEGVFFLPAGKAVRIVDWIKFIVLVYCLYRILSTRPVLPALLAQVNLTLW